MSCIVSTRPLLFHILLVVKWMSFLQMRLAILYEVWISALHKPNKPIYPTWSWNSCKIWSCIVFIFTPETLILISALPCLQLCGVKPSCLLLAWSSTITSQTLFFFLEKAVKYVPLIAILYLLQDFAWKYLSPYLAVLILVTTTNNGRNDL